MAVCILPHNVELEVFLKIAWSVDLQYVRGMVSGIRVASSVLIAVRINFKNVMLQTRTVEGISGNFNLEGSVYVVLAIASLRFLLSVARLMMDMSTRLKFICTHFKATLLSFLDRYLRAGSNPP